MSYTVVMTGLLDLQTTKSITALFLLLANLPHGTPLNSKPATSGIGQQCAPYRMLFFFYFG